MTTTKNKKWNLSFEYIAYTNVVVVAPTQEEAWEEFENGNRDLEAEGGDWKYNYDGVEDLGVTSEPRGVQD